MPAASATAGDTKPLAERMIESRKMRLAPTGLTGSSLRGKCNEVQAEIVMPDSVGLSARRRTAHLHAMLLQQLEHCSRGTCWLGSGRHQE